VKTDEPLHRLKGIDAGAVEQHLAGQKRAVERPPSKHGRVGWAGHLVTASCAPHGPGLRFAHGGPASWRRRGRPAATAPSSRILAGKWGALRPCDREGPVGRSAKAPPDREVRTIPHPTAAADIPILHPSGLHARPAAAFVRTAGRFRAAIRVAHAGREADGKSILEVLTLGVHAGSTVHVVAEGEDAREAVRALVDLAGRRFEGESASTSAH